MRAGRVLSGLLCVASNIVWASDVTITYFNYRRWTLADVQDPYCGTDDHKLRTYEMGTGNPPPDRLQGVNCAPLAEAIQDGSFLTSGFTHGQVEIHFNAEPGFSYWVLWKPIDITPPVIVANGSYGTGWQPISPTITVGAAQEYIFRSGTVEPIAFYRILRR